jgi:23S rRNA pseudouridine1911/1915/1917 synthase
MASAPVLLEDEHLLIVNKPAGMPVQSDLTGDEDLLSRLRRERKEPSLELAHRIDRPVSGVVLLARTADANGVLQSLFRERRIEKRYWAIVEGKVALPSVELEHHVVHDERNRRARIAAQGGGDPARTQVKLLAQGDRYALVEARPEGGAFHQIRAQLAAWGHPIKGDVKYGARRGEQDRSIGLHARSVRFVHPFTGAAVFVEATAPQTMPWPALVAIADAAPTDQ